jgi:hypothetical protein
VIAGLGRRQFIQALSRAEVDAIQITEEELKEEAERDLQARRERLAADLERRAIGWRTATRPLGPRVGPGGQPGRTVPPG